MLQPRDCRPNEDAGMGVGKCLVDGVVEDLMIIGKMVSVTEASSLANNSKVLLKRFL